MKDTAQELWGKVVEQLRGMVADGIFGTWFRPIRCDRAEWRDGTLHLRLDLPNAFHAKWLQRHHDDVLTAAAEAACDGPVTLDYAWPEEAVGGLSEPPHDEMGTGPATVDTPADPLPGEIDAAAGPEGAEAENAPESPDASGPVADAPPAASPTRPEPTPPPAAEATPPARPPMTDAPVPVEAPVLNRHYTFDEFVIGPSNQLPHAAARAVVDAPGQAYNPLFLYGQSGLGKTHLLQAMCHGLLERRPDVRILYLTCETFVNHFVQAVQRGGLQDFRHRYREVDVLVIDDIHFLADKDRTQEEFFHTFNTLYNAQRQVVLSSDSSPSEIPTLEDRLVSRFEWGLVTRIDPPAFETRVAILKRKSLQRGCEMTDETAAWIAGRLAGNVRELEGSVVKILGLARLKDRPVDVGLAREVLGDSDGEGSRSRRISLEAIQEAVCHHYGVARKELLGRRRTKSIVWPRQVCMYLCRDLTDHSLGEIGGTLGGRDHSTVLHAVDKVGDMAEEDGALRDELDALRRRIRGDAR